MLHDVVAFLMQRFWAQVGECAVALICGYALVAGTWRERFGGAIYLAAYLIPAAFASISTRGFDLYFLVADVLCLPGLVTIARNAPHPWPRWAIGGQLASVIADIVSLMYRDNAIYPFYIITEAVLSYIVLIALLTGTIAAQLRRHREGRGNRQARGETGVN